MDAISGGCQSDSVNTKFTNIYSCCCPKCPIVTKPDPKPVDSDGDGPHQQNPELIDLKHVGIIFCMLQFR
jgi:hypothetical protein